LSVIGGSRRSADGVSHTILYDDDDDDDDNNNNNNNNNNIFIYCNWIVTRWQWLFYM
jgi:hypothetical protein